MSSPSKTPKAGSVKPPPSPTSVPPAPIPFPPPPLATTTSLAPPKMSLQFAPRKVRTNNDDETLIPQFSREYRSATSTKEKIQISEKACAGADMKLKKVDYAKIATNEKDDELLKNNLAIETFIRKLKRHAIRYDMHELMTKFPMLEDTLHDHDRFSKGETINLIENWDRIGDGNDKRITVTEIADTVAWIKEYASAGSLSYLEDMEWTHEHILNSLDDELSEIVGTILDQDYSPGQRGGPLTFAIAMDQCINLSEEAIDSLKKSIESFDVKNVKGEDIGLVCRHFKYALKRLFHNGAITPTLTKNLFKVFQTTSVPEFNDFVAHWMRDTTRKSSKRPSYQDILAEVEDYYKRLLASGEWLGITKEETPSGFVGNDKPSSKRNDDVPRPKRNYSRPTDKDKLSSDPKRFQRTIGEREFKWCSKCWNRPSKWNSLTEAVQGRWSTTHFTNEHSGPTEAPTPPDTPQPAANIAGTASKTFAESLQAASGGSSSN